jgi:pimeloyl-ACP methyl ester carboxylesterase
VDALNTLFFFPGVPGSRFSEFGNETVLKRHNIRVVVAERPGVGLSSPLTEYSFVDFANDISLLADHLSADTFAAAGFSGGAPFALATAIALPDRVSRVALLAPLYRYSVPRLRDLPQLGLSNGVYLQTHYPRLVTALAWALSPLLTKPDAHARHIVESSDASDIELFHRTLAC